MIDFLQHLLSGEGFLPRGRCYLWHSSLVWLHGLSDALIMVALFASSIALLLSCRNRRAEPLSRVFIAAGIFAFGCGAVHLIEVCTIWFPVYRLAGVIKLGSAAAGLMALVGLMRVGPLALMPAQHGKVEAVNARLKEALTTLRRRTAELTAADQELEAFSYTVAHDLRAPLRAIDGYSEMVTQDLAGTLSDENAGRLQRIRTNTRTMGRLIDDLLTFRQVARKKLELTSVDLRELCAGVIGQLSSGLAERGVRFVLGELRAVTADRLLLREVLARLIDNAIKYSAAREAPEIEIDSRDDGAERVVWVRDNGIGFDMKYADKLFRVFERLDVGDGRFDGTGIGLPIVARIVRAHGGRVWAQSRPGDGATFFFSLPSTPSELAQANPE